MRLLSLSRFALAAGSALSLLGGVLIQYHAAHAMDWCWDDPVVSLNGAQATFLVGLQGNAGDVGKATANVVVYLPAGVPNSVIVPPALKPFIETLTFVNQGVYKGTGSVPVTVTVSFSSPTALPAALQVTYPNGNTKQYTGTTGGTLTITFNV